MEVDSGAFTGDRLDRDVVQHDIDKWVEFYDDLKAYLEHNEVKSTRNVRKLAENFSLDSDGNVYRWKTGKDGNTSVKVLVVRNYEDRLRIVKDIHVNTGDENRHNRRDRMLELVGQQYYWKGQRRDICECIASCEVCSTGLGGARYSKPPRQARDVRSQAQLQKLSVSPLTVFSPITSAPPVRQPTTNSCLSQTSPLSQSVQSGLRRSTQTGDKDEGVMDVDDTNSPLPQASALLGNSSTSAELVGADEMTSLGFDVAQFDSIDSEHSPSNGGLRNSSPPLSEGFQQFFTTIDVSGTSEEFAASTSGTNPLSPVRSPPLAKTTKSRSTSTQELGPRAQAAVSTGQTGSLYHELFESTSRLTSSLSPQVIEAMHVAMKEEPDYTQLMDSAESNMQQILSLPTDFKVWVTPSPAAAYLLALAASMIYVDPLNSELNITRAQPLAVVSDAYCSGTSVTHSHTCSALLGVSSWRLGTASLPMDGTSLSSALESNRIAAVFYQPYCYPRISTSNDVTPPSDVTSICRRFRTPLILDMDGITPCISPAAIIAEMKEVLVKQTADFVLLPKTERLRGPPETCVLVGKRELLDEVDLTFLQSQVSIPLACSVYDLVGTVVAYRII